MRRLLLAVFVVAADTALTARGLPPWAMAGYAAVACGVVAARPRWAPVAFVAALCLAVLTGRSYVLLLWAAYQAGSAVVGAGGTAVLTGAVAGSLALRVATVGDPRRIPELLSVYAVFVALPALTGRYLAQHRRLIAALDQRNRREREHLADRERLRIARDIHDSLGHRLSLVSIQAAALEVTVPDDHREAVRRLAGGARDAMDELHGLVGTLRGADEPPPGSIEDLVTGFRAAGSPVTLHRHGDPRPLDPPAAAAAYRVVQEALTNAARHAPRQPVTLDLTWETDALLITATNPTDAAYGVAGGLGPAERAHAAAGVTGGLGLVGLGERVRAAGGMLSHQVVDGEFRLVAMVPVADGGGERVSRARTAALGVAAAVLVVVVVPATMLIGVR